MLPLILLLSAWISGIVAYKEDPTLTEERLALSPFIRQLLERVKALEKTGARQEDEIRQLKSEMIRQNANMAQMRYRSSAKDRTIQQLIRKLNSSNKHTASMDKSSSHNVSRVAPQSIENVRKNISAKKTNRIRRAENEVTVAFTAGLSHDMTQVGANQNIVFDQVITNVGNAYNPHHGVFIAPVPGVYVFTTSVLSYDNRNNWVYIALNGVKKTDLFLHDDSHAMGSQTVVLDLNQGDDVAIQGHANDAYRGSGLPYSTFSGFLLQQNFTTAGLIVG